MRISSVSRPLRITQALNGESEGPAVRRNGKTCSITTLFGPSTAPPSTRPWPSRCFGAFERGEPVLEHRHRRIGEARIHRPGLGAAEAGRGLLGAVEHEARGEEEGLGVLVEFGARLAGAHAQGGKLERFIHKKTRSSWF